jgi:hypothetical protein
MALAGGDYEVRIKGRLSDSLLTAFEGLTTTVQPVATVLYGPVQDQAALYRLLDRVQSLGLELVEIRQLPASADEVAAERETNRQIRRASGQRPPNAPERYEVHLKGGARSG